MEIRRERKKRGREREREEERERERERERESFVSPKAAFTRKGRNAHHRNNLEIEHLCPLASQSYLITTERKKMRVPLLHRNLCIWWSLALQENLFRTFVHNYYARENHYSSFVPNVRKRD